MSEDGSGFDVVIVNDVTSTAESSIGGRLRSDFMANPAKIFITIRFESYIVVNQTFNFR
jgi:hypothetical protein